MHDQKDTLTELTEILVDQEIMNSLSLSADDFKNKRFYKDVEVWQELSAHTSRTFKIFM